jgi:hypothetical protein
MTLGQGIDTLQRVRRNTRRTSVLARRHSFCGESLAQPRLHSKAASISTIIAGSDLMFEARAGAADDGGGEKEAKRIRSTGGDCCLDRRGAP